MDEKVPGFSGWLSTGGGKVPRISPELGFEDRLGACKVRWGIGRMEYLVPAGLYAIGTPSAEDPVVVTANYKMSYDLVRQALAGRSVWLLVLETFGINVWCAAGKGTFGTDEVVRRIEETGLSRIVAHRRLLLPILGAPGVAAHEVAKRTGFSISYATIRAGDLPQYLDNGMVTTPAMREMSFTFYERLVLIPVEVMLVLKPLVIFGGAVFAAFFLAAGAHAALLAFVACLGAVLSGTCVTPLMLPFLPARSFAVKGTLAGIAWAVIFYLLAGGAALGALPSTALFLSLPTISAFYALNFTGCTTYTSRSGVKKEMRLAIPLMGSALALTAVLLVAARFC